MSWLVVVLSLAAQQEAELLDLVDELDAVDPPTRESIEAAIERGDDLSELPILVSDLAFTPRSRDGAITLFAAFSHVRSLDEPHAVTAFLLGLTIDFDELLFEPVPYGTPPDERRRLHGCMVIARAPPLDPLDPLDPLEARATAERFRALDCGGAG